MQKAKAQSQLRTNREVVPLPIGGGVRGGVLPGAIHVTNLPESAALAKRPHEPKIVFYRHVDAVIFSSKNAKMSFFGPLAHSLKKRFLIGF
jgi:hypothetical protein